MDQTQMSGSTWGLGTCVRLDILGARRQRAAAGWDPRGQRRAKGKGLYLPGWGGWHLDVESLAMFYAKQ